MANSANVDNPTSTVVGWPSTPLHALQLIPLRAKLLRLKGNSTNSLCIRRPPHNLRSMLKAGLRGAYDNDDPIRP